MSDEERKVWSADNQARMVLVEMGYEWVGMKNDIAIYRKGDQRVGQMAFWRYSHYPFYLWGRITRVNQYGNVETVEYGRGYTFAAAAICTSEEGAALAARLKELERARNNEIAGVERKYLYLLDEAINGKLPRRQ